MAPRVGFEPTHRLRGSGVRVSEVGSSRVLPCPRPLGNGPLSAVWHSSADRARQALSRLVSCPIRVQVRERRRAELRVRLSDSAPRGGGIWLACGEQFPVRPTKLDEIKDLQVEVRSQPIVRPCFPPHRASACRKRPDRYGLQDFSVTTIA